MADASFTKKNFLGSTWKILKWPLAITFVVLSGSFALTSALGTLGFNGTTDLRMISFADWTKFSGKYIDSATGSKGKPYEIIGSLKAPRKTVDNMAYFDRRLVVLLSYLSDGPKTRGSCQGWYPSALNDPRTDKIKLNITSLVDSDLYTPPDNLKSVSTVYRGVGVRFEGMDKIKCTKRCIDPRICDSDISKFKEYEINFDENKGFLDPKPTDVCPPGYECTCAVNRYPLTPRDELDVNEILAEVYNPIERNSTPWGKLMPSDGFAYSTAMADSEGKQAAVYKMTQLVYQIMSIDDKGCLSQDVRTRYGKSFPYLESEKRFEKVTPYQVIFPEWVKLKLDGTATGTGGKEKKIWNDLTKMGSEKYLINLQKNSSLAGVIWDPETTDFFGKAVTGGKSNLEVLHVNY